MNRRHFIRRAGISLLASTAATRRVVAQVPTGPQVDVRKFGARGDGVADDAAAIQKAIDSVVQSGGGVVQIPAGTYRLQRGTTTVREFAMRSGDRELDLPSYYCCLIANANNVQIVAKDARFVVNAAVPFAFYRCTGCGIAGASFECESPEHQAAGAFIVRSWNTSMTGCSSTDFYRGLVMYRSSGCRIDACAVSNARYFGIYSSSLLDVELAGADRRRRNVISNSQVKGSRYGNYFLDYADAQGNRSTDCAPSGNGANHFVSQYGNCAILSNQISESRSQNSGDMIRGVTTAPTQSLRSMIQDVQIRGNRITGCRNGIAIQGIDSFAVEGNTVTGFYLSGILAISRLSKDTAHSLKNGVIRGNTVGPFAADATLPGTRYERRACLHVEDYDDVSSESVVVEENTIDATPLRGGGAPPVAMHTKTRGVRFGRNVLRPPNAKVVSE